jgi:hypothetical protein
LKSLHLRLQAMGSNSSQFRDPLQKGSSQKASDRDLHIPKYQMPHLLSRSPGSPQCPTGHQLQTFTSDENGWNCNCCQKRFFSGTTLHGCRQCNYDVCSKCLKYQQAFHVGELVERRDRGKEWQTGYVTCVNPLKVSFSERPSKDGGLMWDEVRKKVLKEAHDIFSDCMEVTRHCPERSCPTHTCHANADLGWKRKEMRSN